jgi:hypothetical protein
MNCEVTAKVTATTVTRHEILSPEILGKYYFMFDYMLISCLIYDNIKIR